MIESEKAQRRWDRFLRTLMICCMAAYLLTFAIKNVYGFEMYCNTDMYADTLISRLMWEQKTLFPQGWIFSNQYYVVATPVFAAIFYGITGNVNTAMVLAAELMSLLIFVSLFWLVRAFTKEHLTYLLACILLLASAIVPDIPNSFTAELFWLQASYYSCYLIGFFVVVGDYVRCLRSPDRRVGAWILSLLLSFALGIQSLRQTVAMVLPILVCEAFLALRRVIQHQKPWSREHVGSLIRALSYAAANVAGLITLELINPLHSTVFGDFRLTPFREILGRIPSIWPCFAEISGLKFAFNPKYSAACTVLSLFMTVIVLAAAVLWLRRIRRPETPLELCWLVCLVGLVGTALSTVFTEIILRQIYLFLWYPLVVFSGLLIYQYLPLRAKRASVILACLLSLGNLLPYHSYPAGAQAALYNSQSTYGGKAFRLAQAYGMKSYYYEDVSYADAQALCSWALEEGYEYVYGDWFVAPRIAVPSGGRLTAGCWWETSMYEPLDRLTSQNFYDEEDNAKAIYAFTAKDEAQGLALAAKQGVTLTKVADFGTYTAYTSPKQLFSHPWEN